MIKHTDPLQKPPVPEKVYVDGILHSTIVDYHYVAPGSQIFKPGWHPIRVFNFEHPEMKKGIEKTLNEQKAVEDRIRNSPWRRPYLKIRCAA